MSGGTRNSSVICHTNVEMICVTREDFVDIFMHVEDGKEPDHIKFLRHVELIKDWPVQMIPHNDPRVCLVTYFRKGVVICKDTAELEWIYIVKQGSCSIMKSIKVLEKNISFLNHLPESFHKMVDLNSTNKISSFKSIYDSKSEKKTTNTKKVETERSILIELKKLQTYDVFVS
jgi:hypothetical protein